MITMTDAAHKATLVTRKLVEVLTTRGANNSAALAATNLAAATTVFDDAWTAAWDTSIPADAAMNAVTISYTAAMGAVETFANTISL